MKSLKYTFVYLTILALGMMAVKARDLEGLTREATAIFDAKQRSSDPIPAAVLANAKAVGIIKIIQAGIGVLGGSGGEGVILGHTDHHGWSAPVFFHQGGGTLGIQLGADSKSYIYVFNSDDTIHVFTGSDDSQFHSLAQYTADSDHAATVAYNGLPLEQLVVYTSAQGAYAGATVGPIVVGGSDQANQKAYGTSDVNRVLSGDVPAPEYAKELQKELSKASRFHSLSKDK